MPPRHANRDAAAGEMTEIRCDPIPLSLCYVDDVVEAQITV